MQLTYSILAALVIAAVLCTLISALARPHWNAGVSCSRVVGVDGLERDSWSFHAGYANTLLGNTMGKFKVAQARAKFNRQQRKRDASMSQAIN
jgi:hypothetical protein